MKSPAQLAALLRERLIHSRPHYDINGQPLRAIVVTQEWLEDMADAANALLMTPNHQPLTDEQIARAIGFANDSSAALVYYSIARAIERAHGITQSRDSVGHNSTG